ncbi:MAG: DUF996 domain-containing protein [Nitrososphaerota archaeon]|nr:DUF996 domain-containing protein [Nitrososphaerota archaeon]MDG7024923.1 DUF996 domain-containing protein [Nitrososphaerota archaeon]
MATLGQAKTYGGVGSILALLLPVPSIGWLLCIAGLVLVLFAVKYVSEIVKDSSIFNDVVISIVVTIVGVVVGFFVLVASFFRFMGLNNLNFADFGSNFNPSTIPTGDWVGLIMWALLGIVVVWVLLTVSGVFLRRGYSKIGKALNIGMFGTAGFLFLIGAATTILVVGFIIIPIAFILMAVAFLSINENAQVSLQPSPV